MSSDRPENVTILFTVRAATKNGPMSANDYNDSLNELSSDLANITDQWNNRIVPLLANLPNGSDDTSVDAFANGLDGRTLYVHHAAASSDATSSRYYNSTKGRPRTVQEQFGNVYDTIDANLSSVQSEITNTSRTASEIAVLDAGNRLTSENVEDALAELKAAVDYSQASANFVIEATESTATVGSQQKRLRVKAGGTTYYIPLYAAS